MTGTPMAEKIDLLLADVDGTLVTQQKVLTEAAQEAARALRRAGVRLAITSGRPPRGMQMLIAPLAIDTPIAGFNGGAFVNPDMSVVATRALDPAAAAKALKLMTDSGLDAWVYTAEKWFVRDPRAPHVEREAWTVKFEPDVVADFSDLLAHATKIVGVSDDFAKVEAAEQAAQRALGDTASATRSQPYYLDVTHPQANKGGVVHELSRLLSIPRERIATIGDMPNDVLMFRESGFSIAMGNASDAVKKQASAVTDSNEQDGFAHAVARFILNGAGA